MAGYEHKSILIGNIKTYYLEAGKGPDLVLLHGGEFGASAEITWRLNIGTLAKQFHIIAPDMLGFGMTDKIYSFSDPSGFRILHIKKLLEKINIGEAYFVGNSSGGGTILRAAVMDPIPLRIKKMVTIGGNAGVFKADTNSALEDYIPSIENMTTIMRLLFHDEKWLAPEFVEERYLSSIIPGAWEALSAARLRVPGYKRGSSIDGFINRLKQLRIPLLIMAGVHDSLNQKDWDMKFKEIITGSEVHRFQHSAHEPQIEESEEFNRILANFLLNESWH